MMEDNILQKLNDSWEYDSGFFGKLRQGYFDENLFSEFVDLLKSISFEEDFIHRDIVRLLWFIPLFMEWQEERISSGININVYSNKRTLIENELLRILGNP